jgi:3-hydroxy-9,10-secoandrosta-1,3,5(10)-triene-9,17-dione monooxygenase reductase component
MPSPPTAVDQSTYRQVLGRFATGVTLVTGTDPETDTPCALVANSFTSVSIDPPLISFCAGLGSTTWPRLRRSGSFVVNVLGEHHEEICRAIVGKHPDSLELLFDAPKGVSGAPMLPEALAWIECEIETIHEAGDHELVIGRVSDLRVADERAPLVFYNGKFVRLSQSGG